MRATALFSSLVIVPLLIALLLMFSPGGAWAQSSTTTRGAFGGVLSGDMTSGATRGALPPGATVGAARGSVPQGAVVGAARPAASTSSAGAPPSVGLFFVPGAVPAGTPVSPPGAIQVGSGGVLSFRGPVSPDTATGTLGTPIPSNTVLGTPGSAEIAERLQTEAGMWLRDGNYVQGEAMLNRSVAIREEMAGGPNHPEVAQALEDNAKLLRVWNRESAASDMEARAKEIRTNLEPPPAPLKASPAPAF